MKEEITQVKEPCMRITMEITKSDLMERKLFAFTDSTVVEAEKVKNKVAIEAGFSCIPTI